MQTYLVYTPSAGLSYEHRTQSQVTMLLQHAAMYASILKSCSDKDSSASRSFLVQDSASGTTFGGVANSSESHHWLAGRTMEAAEETAQDRTNLT